MKFDCVIQNPPYGSVGGDTLHLKFVDKCFNISDRQVVVMPFSFITKVTNKVQNKFKERFSKKLISAEEVDSSVFRDTAMPNVGIYDFDNNKKVDNIHITYLDNSDKNVKSLLDIKEFSDYEMEFIQYLEQQGSILGTPAGSHDHVTQKSLNKLGIYDINIINEKIKENILQNSKNLPENKILLLCNLANGGMNGTFISSKTGIIYNTKKDAIQMLLDRKTTSGYNFLFFNSIEAAKHCKIALQNPLLRFTCYKTQNDQMMTINKVYRLVPDIDWSDPRVVTDEGLLEVCGCPKEKCKEYADYCKKIIEEVDKKK